MNADGTTLRTLTRAGIRGYGARDIPVVIIEVAPERMPITSFHLNKLILTVNYSMKVIDNK